MIGSDAKAAGAFFLELVPTVALRVLYLARFAWDPMWVNAVYLAQARSIFLRAPRFYGPPGAPLALIAARMPGLAAVPALAVVALIAHVLFAAGTIGLARAIRPDLPRVQERALALIVAAAPLLAGSIGYEDIAVMLGAAFLVCSMAAGAAGARSGSIAWLAVAFAAALAGAATRTEAAIRGVAMAMIVGAAGARRGMPSRRAAAVLAVGVAGGLLVTAAAHRYEMGRFELTDPVYPFYTFSVGMPPRLCDPPCSDEYKSYAQSIPRFGGFVENRGSVIRAIASHPRAFAVRTVFKLGEWIESLATIPMIVLFALAGIGLARLPRGPDYGGFVLLAFLAPMLVLLIPPAVPMYFIVALPAVLIPAAAGAAAVAETLPPAMQVAAAAGIMVFGVAWAGYFGFAGPSIPRVLNAVSRDLERRCAAGCLVNYVPPHVLAEAWVVLDAGAPLPAPPQTDERFALGHISGALADASRYRDRVSRARAAGYRGPVLYHEVEARSAHAFSDLGFDREHDLEGPVDLSRARLEAVFAEGIDRAALWSFPPGRDP